MSHAMTGSRSAAGAIERFAELCRRFSAAAAAIPASLPLLVLRLAVAIPFWKSGMLKWDGFLRLSDTAVLLFREEFRLHVFGAAYAYPAPALFAFGAGIAEVLFSTLLVLGLATRAAALGLLVMTGIIQLTVPDGWQTYHLPWAAMLLAILAYGPGRLSADCLLRRLAG